MKMSVEKLTSVLDSLKLSSKDVKEEKDFCDRIVSTVQAESKTFAKILPSLMDMVCGRIVPLQLVFLNSTF